MYLYFFEYFSKSVIFLLLKYILLEAAVLCYVLNNFHYKVKSKAETRSLSKFSMNWCCVCELVSVHLIGSG